MNLLSHHNDDESRAKRRGFLWMYLILAEDGFLSTWKSKHTMKYNTPHQNHRNDGISAHHNQFVKQLNHTKWTREKKMYTFFFGLKIFQQNTCCSVLFRSDIANEIALNRKNPWFLFQKRHKTTYKRPKKLYN